MIPPHFDPFDKMYPYIRIYFAVLIVIIACLEGCVLNGTHPPSTFGNYFGKLPDNKTIAVDARYSDVSTNPEYEEGSLDVTVRMSQTIDMIIGASSKDYYYKPAIGKDFGSTNGKAEGGYIGINWLVKRNIGSTANLGLIPSLGYETAPFGDIYSLSIGINAKAKKGVFVSGLGGRIYSAITTNGVKIVNDLEEDIWEQNEVEERIGPVIGIELNPFIGVNLKDYIEVSSGFVGGVSKTGSGSNGILAYALSATILF